MFNTFEVSASSASNKPSWKFGLYAMKTEIVLYDLKQAVFWQSLVEVAIMLCAFIALLTSHCLLFFMHVVHIIRPVVAVRVITKLPRTHDIIEEISDDVTKAQSEASQIIIDRFKLFSSHYSHYFLLSGVAAVFDVLALLYTISNLGGVVDAYVFYLNAAAIFLFFDFYVLLWANSLAATFPKSLCETSTTIANNSVKDTSDMVNGYLNKLVKT
jgi:hypothetical protein